VGRAPTPSASLRRRSTHPELSSVSRSRGFRGASADFHTVTSRSPACRSRTTTKSRCGTIPSAKPTTGFDERAHGEHSPSLTRRCAHGGAEPLEGRSPCGNKERTKPHASFRPCGWAWLLCRVQRVG